MSQYFTYITLVVNPEKTGFTCFQTLQMKSWKSNKCQTILLMTNLLFILNAMIYYKLDFEDGLKFEPCTVWTAYQLFNSAMKI